MQYPFKRRLIVLTYEGPYGPRTWFYVGRTKHAAVKTFKKQTKEKQTIISVK